MKGFPPKFKTKRDLEVGVQYATENPAFSDRMRKELEKIRDSVSFRTLKQEVVEKIQKEEEAAEKGEEYTPYTPTEEDYEMRADTNAILYKMGMSEQDINELIAKLPQAEALR